MLSQVLIAAVLTSSDAGGTSAHQRLRTLSETRAAAGLGSRIVVAWTPHRPRIAGR